MQYISSVIDSLQVFDPVVSLVLVDMVYDRGVRVIVPRPHQLMQFMGFAIEVGSPVPIRPWATQEITLLALPFVDTAVKMAISVVSVGPELWSIDFVRLEWHVSYRCMASLVQYLLSRYQGRLVWRRHTCSTRFALLPG